MKLVEMARHHTHNVEARVKKLVKYCNDSDYVVKIRHNYDNEVKIIAGATFVDQAEIDKHYDEGDEPFVAVTFAGHEDSDIFVPEDFIEIAEVYTLKRII